MRTRFSSSATGQLYPQCRATRGAARLIPMTPGAHDPGPAVSPSPDPAKVLTVCLGNICRSPAMEFYLERAWGADADVTSAGTMAATGWHIPEPMRAVEEAAGLTVTHHDPRQLDVAIIDTQDLILVAANSQKEWIERHVGAVPVNTCLLYTSPSPRDG